MAWNHLVFLGIGWFAFTVPFHQVPAIGNPLWLVETNLMWSAFFLADILANLRTAYLEDGEYVTNLGMISANYRRTWLLPDLLATIPWDAMAYFGGYPEWVPYLGLLRLACLTQVFRLSRTHTTGLPPTVHGGIIILLFWISFAICWISTGWLFLNPPDGSRLISTEIIESIYWAITTLASVGYGDITPKTDGARIYAATVMLLGVGMFGLVVGNAVSLVSSLNAHRNKAMDRITQLAALLRQYPMPQQLNEEVSSYYRHLMSHHEDVQTDFLGKLPEKLRQRIFHHVTGHLLNQVEIFKGASEELLKDLARKLKREVYMPGEEIIRVGDPGNEMYFLIHGTAAVSNSAGEFLAKLRMNSAFGETALLFDQPRTATIRALTYCSLFKLEKSDFYNVLEHHPEFRTRLLEMAKSRR
ncbi:MAG: cyclic nucleotide-binding domain-containing protein [Magnetococcales bacterium]|nr:cyclic nucleotide-binding domain-containing protein [Magnetococcales bacterium]